MADSSAPRPSRPSATCCIGLPGNDAKIAAGSGGWISAVSVIRSCSGAASADSSAGAKCVSLTSPASRPLRASMRYSMPRSMRRTPLMPQLRAMSVALLAHGDTVPRRGTTQIGWAPLADAPDAPDALPSRAASRACSSADNGCSLQTA